MLAIEAKEKQLQGQYRGKLKALCAGTAHTPHADLVTHVVAQEKRRGAIFTHA